MTEDARAKFSGTLRIEMLDSTAINDVLALREVARTVLPASQKTKTSRPTTFFQSLLSRLNGAMIGARADGQLIAHMALLGPMELREAILMHTVSESDVLFHHAGLMESIVAFEALTVDPDWQSDNLAEKLVAYALELPMTRVAAHVFAPARANDYMKCSVFLRQGFGIVAANTASADGQPRFIFQKPAFGFDFAPEVIAEDVDAVGDFVAISNLTQREALVGVLDMTAPNKLAFMRSRDVLNLMPTMAKIMAET